MRDYFDPDWAEYIFGLLFTATWQAALLVALALLGSLCVRRAVVRCAIWSACVVGLAATPLAGVLLPHAFLAYTGSSEPLHFPSCIARPRTSEIGNSSFWSPPKGVWRAGACRAVAYIWLAGIVVALARLASGWVSMIRLLRLARPCRDPRVQKIVAKVVLPAERVTVLELEGLVGAVCWQIHRPKLILPADANRLSDAELEMMVQHELAHVRRSDPGMLFIQRLVEVFYWFHPVVWWVTLQTSKYREFVCGDLVLSSGYRAGEYAQCLGRLAVSYYAPPPTAPAGLGMLWSQHLVLQRVRRLVQAGNARQGLSPVQKTAFGLTVAAAIFVIGIVRFDWSCTTPGGKIRWTAWPPWSASALDTIGIPVRDFPLDAHRYDLGEHGGGS